MNKDQDVRGFRIVLPELLGSPQSMKNALIATVSAWATAVAASRGLLAGFDMPTLPANSAVGVAAKSRIYAKGFPVSFILNSE